MNNRTSSPDFRQPGRHRFCILALVLLMTVLVCIPFAAADNDVDIVDASHICGYSYTLTISGTPSQGYTLTAVNSTILPSGTHYDWEAATQCYKDQWHIHSELQDSHSTTYVVGSGLVGKYIWVRTTNIPYCNNIYSSGCVLVTVATPAPTFDSITPNAGPTAGGQTVNITGTNFVSGGSFNVSIGGADATDISWISSTEISAVTPAHAPGAVDVVIFNNDGQHVTGSGAYTYLLPAIATISRNSGPTLTGVLVTITGTTFTGATGVTFGGVNAMDYTVDSDTQITAFTPAVTSPDTVDVNVTAYGGMSTENFQYTYTEPTATIGVFRDGVFYLRNINTAGDADNVFAFGQAGDTPLIGDWTGKGWDSPGVVKDTLWTLRNSNTAGDPEISFHYGDVGDKPIVGDWTDKGWDSPGIVRDNYWFLKNSNTDGPAETVFTYGLASDIPLAGDWTGKGWDSPGVYRAADKTFFLRNSNTDGTADFAFSYGEIGDIPVIWHHDNMDTVGVFRNGVFYLRTSNSVGAADTYAFTYGQTGDIPFTGLWEAPPI